MLIATLNAWHAFHVCMAAQSTAAGILALIAGVTTPPLVIVAVVLLLCICHLFVRKNMCIP